MIFYPPVKYLEYRGWHDGSSLCTILSKINYTIQSRAEEVPINNDIPTLSPTAMCACHTHHM